MQRQRGAKYVKRRHKIVNRKQWKDSNCALCIRRRPRCSQFQRSTNSSVERQQLKIFLRDKSRSLPKTGMSRSTAATTGATSCEFPRQVWICQFHKSEDQAMWASWTSVHVTARSSRKTDLVTSDILDGNISGSFPPSR